jgi:malonyl-CoA O-methyltransferase
MRNNPIDVMRNRYDQFSSTYVSKWSQLEGYSGLVREFLTREVHEGEALLDVGCGPGQLTTALHPSVRVTGIDISEAMLAEARVTRPSGTYLVHDYYQPLPAGLGRFDVILAVGSLDFCEDLDLVLGHLAAACNPGARVLANLIERRAGVPGHELRRLPISPERMPGVDLLFYTLPEMASAIERAGFLARSYVHYKGYRNQYHELDIQYGLWELERPA